MFTLDDVTGEFYLTRSNIVIPEYGSIYSFNDANSLDWDPCVQSFVHDFKTNKLREEMQAPKNTKSTSRYMGALVADIHNILLNGGVYGYPGTVDKPAGKLRLLYETNPISLLLEEAGGAASDGRSRILDVVVDHIHQRTSFFGGSKNVLDIVNRYYKEADSKNKSLR
jgi:fructose-1,6-bisphosphatase I